MPKRYRETVAGPEHTVGSHMQITVTSSATYYIDDRGAYLVIVPSVHYLCPGADNCPEFVEVYKSDRLKCLTLDECYIKGQALSHHITSEITV